MKERIEELAQDWARLWEDEDMIGADSEDTVEAFFLRRLESLAAQQDNEAIQVSAAYEEDIGGRNRELNQLRADNEALRGRLDGFAESAAAQVRPLKTLLADAVALLRRAPTWATSKEAGSAWYDDAVKLVARFDALASGSSTGEAPNASESACSCPMRGVGMGYACREERGWKKERRPWRGACACDCHRAEPAAPEPAPAPGTEPRILEQLARLDEAEGLIELECSDHVTGCTCSWCAFNSHADVKFPAAAAVILRDKTISLGDHDLCAPCLRSEHPYAHFPNTPCPAAPASAQGMTFERDLIEAAEACIDSTQQKSSLTPFRTAAPDLFLAQDVWKAFDRFESVFIQALDKRVSALREDFDNHYHVGESSPMVREKDGT